MRKLAAEKNLCTQMGNQGTAHDGFRQGVALLQSGMLGQIKDIHVWTNRPIWPQGMPKPEGTPGIPNHVRWYEFLGPAHDRPYHPAYQPFAWRGWLDFGTGALGDMACHTINVAAMALELFDPESDRGGRHLRHRRQRLVPHLVDHPHPVRPHRQARTDHHDLVRRR